MTSMPVQHKTLSVKTRGKGTSEVTEALHAFVKETGFSDGVLTVFCRHTSCSLVIMENADPSARHDLEAWMERTVPESDPHFTHTYEGPDDMPSHIKMALTRTCEVIPVASGRLVLGTWQGCFLWEHRAHGHTRSLHLALVGG